MKEDSQILHAVEDEKDVLEFWGFHGSEDT